MLKPDALDALREAVAAGVNDSELFLAALRERGFDVVPIKDDDGIHDQDAQHRLIEEGLRYVGQIQRQPLHGVGAELPKGIMPAEGYVATRAYEAATGENALGVGISHALGAAAFIRDLASGVKK